MLAAFSVIGYLAMVGGLVGLLATRSVFSPNPLVILTQLAGVALMLWARVTFGRRSFHLAANPTAGGLITTGPYHFIRHPIYTGVCLFTAAAVASHWNWRTAMLGCLIFAGSLSRVLCEEALLVKRYPEYRQYALKTRRMIPLVF